MTDKVAKIAASLTEAARAIVLRSMPEGELLDAGAYFDLPDGLATVMPAGFGSVDYLTPLGLAVRQHLPEQQT